MSPVPPAVPPDHDRRNRFLLNLAVVIAVGMVAHVFRSSTAVVAPDIIGELGLAAGWAAYLTSGFFAAAMIVQIPVGIMYDAVGLRVTIPLMLGIAAAGAVVFATAEGAAALLVGRILMGVGAGALIMGGLVLCARWLPPERFPALVGMVLALSQVGNIGATAPVAIVAAALGWRGAFLCLAALALLIALVYLLRIEEYPPEAPRAAAAREGFAASVRGSLRILCNRELWPVFAMAFVSYAVNFSVAGVWGGVYLSEVFGFDVVMRGYFLLLMASAFALGLVFFGWLGQKLRSLKRAVLAGSGVSAALFLLAALVPDPSPVAVGGFFLLLGAAGGACGTIIPHGRNFYPSGSIGRGVTVLNTIVLLGALAVQISTGLLMDILFGAGMDASAAFRVLFATHACALVTGMLVYSRARETAPETEAAAAM